MLDSSSEDESQDEPENGSIAAVLKKELLAYRNKKRINVNENPLNWWSVHRGEFKVLSPIVRRFLSAPPGSVPSEQLFSGEPQPYPYARETEEAQATEPGAGPPNKLGRWRHASKRQD
nr:unnamed protein product [Callosobruchus chinensis]